MVFRLYTFIQKYVPSTTFTIISNKIGDFKTKELDKWEYPLMAISDDIDNHLVDNYNKITVPPKLQTHPTELALYQCYNITTVIRYYTPASPGRSYL